MPHSPEFYGLMGLVGTVILFAANYAIASKGKKRLDAMRAASEAARQEALAIRWTSVNSCCAEEE